MEHSNEWHISAGDILEHNDAEEREYIHDAMEAMEHGLSANEFRMRESMPAQDA